MNNLAQHYADPRFLDTTALARRWDVSPRTVEGWRHRGVGPPWRKFGGHVRYFMGDIVAFESESLIASSRSAYVKRLRNAYLQDAQPEPAQEGDS